MKEEARERIDFVVGEERSLAEVLAETEVSPLLAATVSSGATLALLRQADGVTLWSQGTGDEASAIRLARPLCLEGEPLGTVVVAGHHGSEDALNGLAGLLAVALQTLATSNLKRMLTTEIHTTVVNRSYDELLESNRLLALSEGRYRELAANLELKVEERTAELKRVHVRLLQQEKLAAVGQLAAGMAHEINNPLGFISSNLNTLKRYAANLNAMVGLYRQTLAGGGVEAGSGEELDREYRRLKLDFILTDLDDLIAQSLAGCARVGKIVADLKGFSHIDESPEVVVDLNREIDRTLGVLVHQIPPATRIDKRYAKLSGFPCNAARLCQVFFNIILNAVQARPAGLRLTIETREEGGEIVLLFGDNGPGMAPEVVNRIFEPFFTTRDVGAGMGMGLAEAYDVITAYGGTIEARSEPGQGTTFRIALPLPGQAGTQP